MYLIGVATLLTTIGCEIEEGHRYHHYRGGVYDDSYRGYGHGEYRDYYPEHRYDRYHWEYHD